VSIAAEDVPALADFAKQHNIGMTVVGPEAPLALGIVDYFRGQGLQIFGPDAYCAQLEASKAFSKRLMQRCGIPTASALITADIDEARAYIHAHSGPLVVKADGLAAGKGVIVCDTAAQAEAAARAMLEERIFGEAGATILLEERLTGREISVLAFCDGQAVHIMPVARDYKRAFDNDEGPNTGGMGAIAPAPDVSADVINEVVERVIMPAVKGLAADGHLYVGVLYAGIMLTQSGIMTLEFNCRFGDPETQVILPLLRTDLLSIAQACTTGTLASTQITWHEAHSAAVVMASGGYPGSYETGFRIEGLAASTQDGVVFHAGTRATPEGHVVTSGGRVLAAAATAPSLAQALSAAYAIIGGLHFHGAHYRRDIGRIRQVQDT
jgi:phosphoribosylamine--glycine ligase